MRFPLKLSCGHLTNEVCNCWKDHKTTYQYKTDSESPIDKAFTNLTVDGAMFYLTMDAMYQAETITVLVQFAAAKTDFALMTSKVAELGFVLSVIHKAAAVYCCYLVFLVNQQWIQAKELVGDDDL